jgi:hypothetical protein
MRVARQNQYVKPMYPEVSVDESENSDEEDDCNIEAGEDVVESS